jgi:hypothetical protein
MSGNSSLGASRCMLARHSGPRQTSCTLRFVAHPAPILCLPELLKPLVVNAPRVAGITNLGMRSHSLL